MRIRKESKYVTLFLTLLSELDTARFRDFQKRIGANDRTIRDVLNRLIGQGLVVKDHGIHPAYRITEKGRLALLEHREIDAVRKIYEEKRYESTARKIIDALLGRENIATQVRQSWERCVFPRSEQEGGEEMMVKLTDLPDGGILAEGARFKVKIPAKYVDYRRILGALSAKDKGKLVSDEGLFIESGGGCRKCYKPEVVRYGLEIRDEYAIINKVCLSCGADNSDVLD